MPTQVPAGERNDVPLVRGVLRGGSRPSLCTPPCCSSRSAQGCSAMIASVQMIVIIILSAGCALLVSHHALKRLVDMAWLAGLTLTIGLPIWLNCDSYLLHLLPIVWWFDPREPFAPYVLLYLPLSLVIATTPA